MLMLTGEYSHQLDAKNRMRIPAKLRKELGDEFYFVKGSDSCVFVYPKEVMLEKLAYLNQIKYSSDPKLQKSARVYAKNVTPVCEDSQGRLLLPQKLREHMGLEEDDKDIVTIGAGSRVEIWSKKHYDKYFEDEDEVYDSLLSMLDI